MNKREPLISVVIPIHNTEKYLTKCLDSVINQSHSNLEIICVNDGSTDKSGDILNEYAKKDNRIIAIHQGKRGVSAARNNALRNSSGEYIGFVDSDDYIDSRMYEKLLREMRADVDIVSCNYYMDYEQKTMAVENKCKVPTGPIRTTEFLKYVYERDKYKGVASYVWNRLFRRDLLIASNGKKFYFNENYVISEDLIFMAMISVQSKKCVYLNEPLYYYVQRNDSTVHDWTKQLESLDWISAYEKILALYESEDIPIEVINLVKRMYVYRCGKHLEIAIKSEDKEKFLIVKQKALKYYDIYLKTNREQPDRVKWINNLMSFDWEKRESEQ